MGASVMYSTCLHLKKRPTHSEMIPGGKLLGMALLSRQKALSLVQEQVGGQRGVFGALLPSDWLSRQRLRTHKRTKLVDLKPGSGIARQDWRSQLAHEPSSSGCNVCEWGGGGRGGGAPWVGLDAAVILSVSLMS